MQQNTTTRREDKNIDIYMKRALILTCTRNEVTITSSSKVSANKKLDNEFIYKPSSLTIIETPLRVFMLLI